MFINYQLKTGLSITTDRLPGASAGDIVDLTIAFEIGTGGVCCDLDGAKDALEDGAVWEDTPISQETLEEIHALICEHES